MINLPPLLSPSSLLYCKGLTPSAEMLSEECSKIDAESRFDQIEQLAQRSRELQQRKGDWIGCAVALLHLGDRCREAGRLGPAQRYCEQARQLFHRYQFVPEQRYNEATATYALGLVHQLLGDEREALDQYEQAIELFAQVHSHWQLVGNKEMDQRCEQASRLIEELRKYVAEIRSRGGTTALPYLFLSLSRRGTIALPRFLPIYPWPGDVKQMDRLPAEVEVKHYTLTRKVHIGDKDYQLHPVKPGTLTLKPGEEYCILPAPDQEIPDLDVQEADYVLVQQDNVNEGPGALYDDGTILWGQFTRDAQKKLQFIFTCTSHPDKPPIIIGAADSDVRLLGNPVAILEPTTQAAGK